jgi:hypothetical protein
VEHCLKGQLDAPVDQKAVGADDDGVGSLARKRRERGIDLAAAAGVEDLDLQPHGTSRRFHASQCRLGSRRISRSRNAQRLFEKQNPREKRRLLNFVVSNCTWKGGELVSTLRQPFDLVAETTAIAAQAAADNSPNLAKSEIWLPFQDTYRTMCHAPEPAFRRVLEDIRELRFAA